MRPKKSLDEIKRQRAFTASNKEWSSIQNKAEEKGFKSTTEYIHSLIAKDNKK